VLCGADHNLRMNLRKLRILYAVVLYMLLSPAIAALLARRSRSRANELFRAGYLLFLTAGADNANDCAHEMADAVHQRTNTGYTKTPKIFCISSLSRSQHF
jgi:hypothetical protein